MAELFIAPFTPALRDQTIERLAKQIGAPEAKVVRADTRKPYLREDGRKTYGLAITHLRRCASPFSLMATSLVPHIGLDAEVWSKSSGDAVFLNSIAAPEDAPIASHLNNQGCDAALFLWVAKEAAVKAFGSVMVDPRDVAIKHEGKNHFRAMKSKGADLKLATTKLAFYLLNAPQSGERVLLAASISGQGRVSTEMKLIHGKELELKPLNLDSL